MVKSTVDLPPLPPLGANAARVGSSAIRDLLEVAHRPGVISLAGGLPDPATFPVAAIATATAAALAGDPLGTLQYGRTEGHEDLRVLVADDLGTAPDRILITSGSQQALDLLARTIVDPGGLVALGDPAYVGALQAFRAAAATLVPVPTDHRGLRVDVLADRLHAGLRPALVYVVSSFDNPTGATLAAPWRVALAELAEHYGFWIVDDDPYGALRWAGHEPEPLRRLTDRTITLGSTSKVLCPGMRVGWLCAAPSLVRDITILKQSADLHTSTLSQAIVARLLADRTAMDAHGERLRRSYRARAEVLAASLRDRLGERLRFRLPDGGMFLWATLAGGAGRGRTTGELLPVALEQGTAFVPGSAFAVSDPRAHDRSLRLSFATAAPHDLDEAARRLAVALR